MPAPDITDVKVYLGDDHSWTDSQIQSALDAETAAQAARCKIPVEFPADLAEALCRRVAANLAVRALPLGLQSSMSEMAVSQVRVGGGDREVKRLEGPYRRLTVG